MSYNKCGHGKGMREECLACVALYRGLDTNQAMRDAIRKEERERAAGIANELAQSHSRGGFSALGFNIARAILGE